LSRSPVKKTEITAVGIRRADHATPCICKKLALSSPTSCGRSVGIVHSRAITTELCFVIVKTDCEAQPTSYPMGTCDFSPRGKASGAWNWPLKSN
jgi:hypothetical protein